MLDAACDWPLETCLDLSVRHSLWLPLLGLGVCRKNQAVHQGRILEALSPWEGELKSQISQSSAFVCRLSVRLKLSSAVLFSSQAWAPQGRVRRILECGAIAYPRLMPHGGECSAWERWFLQYGEWLSLGILAADPSALSQELLTPDSPQVSVVHSALPLS